MPSSGDIAREAKPGGPFRLSSDLRLDLFAVLFAFGTVLHELQFLMEQAVVGPFGEYMERWSRVVPSTGWSSEIGIALNVVIVALSLLILLLPWRRELLCLLAVPFLLSQLASPDRISSHSGLMAGGLLVISILGAAEWLDRALVRGSRTSPGGDWYGWTLTGLAWICALTYFFAFFYKLNPAWFSEESPGPGFLIRPVAPILDRLGAPSGFRALLAAVAVYGTLLVELALPLFLFQRRTRLFGGFLGLLFHLPMIAQGVSDFPVLVLAFYPAFLSLAETRELLRRLTRPSAARLAGTVLLGGFGVWVVLRAPKLIWFYKNATDLDPLVRIANTGLTCASLVCLLYATLTLGAWLISGDAGPGAPRGRAPRRGSPGPVPEASRGRAFRRGSRGSRAAAAGAVLSVGAALVYTNVAPFFGLTAAGAMTMYSGISVDRGNHFLLPNVRLTDSYEYVSVARFEPQGIETREAREFGAFLQWIDDQAQQHRVNLNFLRYHMSRICGSARGGTVRLELRKSRSDARVFENVCAEPSMQQYVPIPIAHPCNPHCDPVVRAWARNQLRID